MSNATHAAVASGAIARTTAASGDVAHTAAQAARPGAASYDVESIRKEFPALHQRVHGKPLAYLDNAATAHKPLAVLDATRRFYENDNSNVHRGVHDLSERATRSYEGSRDTVRRFLNAQHREEVVFVRGATEGINLLAHSFVRPRLTPGDEVVITAMEHHSNIVPWQMACDATGARLRVAPIDDRGQLDLVAFERLLSPRTRFAALSHVSNALGTINPAKTLVDLCHARGVPVLLDGAQAVPHLGVDVRAIGCDFYVFSGHKVYGPTGIGALYGRREHFEAMPPWQGGGDMIRSVTFEKTTYNDLPYKFEAGTPDIAGAIGLGAALDYVSGIGLDRIAAHEHRLLEHATRLVSSIPGLRVIGEAQEKAAVLSVHVDGVHPHDVGTLLDRDGVAVRTGHHCAMPIMDRFNVPATTRASFGLYNTMEEAERFAVSLARAVEAFR